MPQIKSIKPIGAEGAIEFRLTPIQNGTDRLFLIDVGAEKTKNRITLLVTKNAGARFLTLELFNDVGTFMTESKPFPAFQLGSAFSVALEWSSEKHIVAVYIDDDDDEFLKIKRDDIVFTGLGNVIHSGEDVDGRNKTEMLTSGDHE